MTTYRFATAPKSVALDFDPGQVYPIAHLSEDCLLVTVQDKRGKYRTYHMDHTEWLLHEHDPRAAVRMAGGAAQIAAMVLQKETPAVDLVNHPPHYTKHPSGVECIQITEHMGFNLGNAVKYIWRADEKGNALQDLEKAAWYVNRELEKRRKAQEDAR